MNWIVSTNDNADGSGRRPGLLWLENRVEGGTTTSTSGGDIAMKRRPHGGRLDEDRTSINPLSPDVLRQMNLLWLQYCDGILGSKPLAQKLNLLQKIELIGAEVEVVKSKNPSNLHIHGVVLLETARMIIVQGIQDNKIRSLRKEDIHFKIKCNGGVFLLIGQAYSRDPATRTKAKPKQLNSTLLT